MSRPPKKKSQDTQRTGDPGFGQKCDNEAMGVERVLRMPDSIGQESAGVVPNTDAGPGMVAQHIQPRKPPIKPPGILTGRERLSSEIDLVREFPDE